VARNFPGGHGLQHIQSLLFVKDSLRPAQLLPLLPCATNARMDPLFDQIALQIGHGAGDNLKDIASLLLETGMRPEEVYRIQVENVFIDQGYLFNPFGKTKAAKRKIPLNEAAFAIVKRRVEAAEGVYLFPHRKDANKPMLKVNNAHDRALKKSKVRKFRLYDLRHTWATRAAESGEVDMTTLAALLGHSKLNMVMRYAHPHERHQADAVKRLEKVNAARQIAAFEKKNSSPECPLQFPLQWPKNPAFVEESKTEGKSQQIN
jgi:Phage integrase family